MQKNKAGNPNSCSISLHMGIIPDMDDYMKLTCAMQY